MDVVFIAVCASGGWVFFCTSQMLWEIFWRRKSRNDDLHNRVRTSALRKTPRRVLCLD